MIKTMNRNTVSSSLEMVSSEVDSSASRVDSETTNLSKTITANREEKSKNLTFE